MPYGNVTLRRLGRKAIIVVDLPPKGEPSISGRADNLVDPRMWIEINDPLEGLLSLKMTLCRPYSRRAIRGTS